MTAIQGINPRTGSPVGEAIEPTPPPEVAAVLAAADTAYASYAVSAPQVRTALLRALADTLDAHVSTLVPLAMAETGLPEARLTGEVARTSGQLRLFAEVVEDGAFMEAILDSAEPSANPPVPDLRRVLEPLGPVLVFAASNFPFAFSVLGGDTASALACGAPVVVKAHSGHPGVSAAVAALARAVVREQGLPEGVFGILFGTEAGVEALRDPRVRAAGFTGSTHAGRLLFDIAAGRPDPIPFYGELGSVNPVVVTPAALARRQDELLTGFVSSFTLGAGQFCTKPGLLLVPAGAVDLGALEALVAQSAAAPLLNARIRSQLDAGMEDLAAHGAVTRVAEGAPAPEEGAWASPTVFRTTAAELAADPAVLAAEHFGPVALVVEYADEAELLTALGAVEGTLTATIHAEDADPFPVDTVVGLVRQRAGRVIFDGWPTGVAVTWSMQHGGPWPATTSAGHTSVGATATRRWLRPVCYQSVPARHLPPALHDDNPWGLPRRVDGHLEVREPAD